MSEAAWSSPPHVLLVAGARPNFPKLKPVLDAFEARSCPTTFVHTGQHYDPALSDVFLDELGIRSPDRLLGVGSGSHATQTAAVMTAFEPIVDELAPDVVVVAGDVNSTVACALVGAKRGCLVAHVEAGLRSRDWSMPEEVNRLVTDRLSDHLLAPSPDAVDNLRAEGYRDDQIHLVGNVMIDTLLANRARAIERLPRLRDELDLPGRFALATLHRPSNVDDAEQLASLLGALGRVADDVPVVLPVHPRTRSTLGGRSPGGDVRLVEPFGYLDFLALQSAAAVVLTDSGGIQEETTALGTPCLTLRTTTERPITIEQGTNRLVGTDPAAIVDAARSVLADGVEARCPGLWDGHAGERVADAVLDGGPPSSRRRPSER